MNARKSLLIVLPLVALVMMACSFQGVRINRIQVEGSGTLGTENRNVRDVERVSLEDIGELEIIQGDEEGLTVEADENILPYIETVMRGRELVISIQDGVQIETDTPIRYMLKVKKLNRVSVSGSGNVHAAQLQTDDFEVTISGSGNVSINDLMADALRVRTSGSGNFELAGEVETQNIDISGSGNYSAGELASQRADVSITGAGNVTVWVAEELNIRVSGFGNVEYYGSPEISQTITGAGEVKNLGESK